MEKAFKGFTARRYPSLLFGYNRPAELPKSSFAYNRLAELLHNFGPRGVEVAMYDLETCGLNGERLLYTYGKGHVRLEQLGIELQSNRTVDEVVHEAMYAAWGCAAVEHFDTLYLTPKPADYAWYQKPSLELLRLTEEQVKEHTGYEGIITMFDSILRDTLRDLYDRNYREGAAVHNAWYEKARAEKIANNKPRSKYIW